MRNRALALAMVGLLAACGNVNHRERASTRTSFVPPGQAALVVQLDPRVAIPQGSDPSFDVGRLFGESMIAELGRDPRVRFASAPPANVLHLWVRQYGPANQTQVSMIGGAELDDPAGRKLWASELSVTRTSIQAAADALANRLRSDMMLGHGSYVNRPQVATAPSVSGTRREPAAPPPAAAPAAAPQAAPAAAAKAAPAPRAAPAAAPRNPPEVMPSEADATVARAGTGLRKKPQAWLPLVKSLDAGTHVHVSSRLQNEDGVWWYAKSAEGKGWIPEADVALP